MEPWLSWGIALVVGGLAFAYYNVQKKPQVNKTRAASISDAVPSQIKPTRKREENKVMPKTQAATSSAVNVTRPSVEAGNGNISTSGAESSKKRKVNKKQPVAAAVAPVTVKAPVATEVEEADDNKAWAQQLLALKQGTSLAPPVRTDSRSRTVKQSAANLTPNLSSASSNAGYADDDLTPARSPALAAGDVSDMLEPTTTGPSVLRLTESSKPAKANKQRQQTAAQEAETKKQRQNRKKVEERQAQREAEEKERVVLLEKQRRTAREARGEPAKNGVSASKPPAVSEWAVKAAARATEAPAQEITGGSAGSPGLLDTFDKPSEEEQMRIATKLSEDESGWNTVPKGKKQKKKAPTTGLTESNGSDSFEQPTAAVPAPAPVPVSAPAPTPAPVPVSKPVEAYANGYASPSYPVYDAGSHPEDSPWSA